MSKLLILLALVFSMAVSANISQAEEVEAKTSRKGKMEKRMDNRMEKKKEIYSKMNASQDVKISLDEYLAKAKERFAKKDKDGDGFLTREEMRPQGRKPMMDGDMMRRKGGRDGKGKGEGRYAPENLETDDIDEDMED